MLNHYMKKIPTYLFWGVLFIICVLPIIRILLEALWGVSTDNSVLFELMSDPLTYSALYNTVVTGVLSTIVATVLGTFFAVVLSNSTIRFSAVWIFAIMVPLIIPPQITALSWLQLFGPSSSLLQSINLAPAIGSPQPLYSAGGISLLMGIQHMPLVFLTVRTHIASIPSYLSEAASLSGASPIKILLTIILPLLRSGIMAGAAIAFVAAIGNFGIPAILGIPVGYYVLSTLIYQKMASFGGLMIAQVAILSLLVILLSLIGIAFQRRLQRHSIYQLTVTSGCSVQIIFSKFITRLILVIMVCVLLFILVAPMAALIVSSFVPSVGIPLSWETLSFHAYYEMLFTQPITLRAFKNSLLLTSTTVVILMFISVPFVWILHHTRSRILQLSASLFDLPYAIPGTVLAIACILLWANFIPNYSLLGTITIILLAYLARFFVIVIKPVQASFIQLDPALEEAARLSGASSWQSMHHIVRPIIAPSIFAGGLLVFLSALNELTVSALLWSAGNETLGVLIFNFNDSGDSVLAAAISVVITLFVLLVMFSTIIFGRYLPKGAIPWQA